MRFALTIFLILLVPAGFVCVHWYSFIFSKKVRGEIIRVERVTNPETIVTLSPGTPTSLLYSFAIAIRDEAGEIHTASTEDRQWAVVEKGQCAEASFFPYPPWNLEKANTYHGARLERLFDCVKKP